MSRSKPATDLQEVLSRMSFEVLDGRFALLGFEEAPEARDLDCLRAGGPAQLIRELGETTLLLPESERAAELARHPAARVETGLVWIRFRAPMDWELVGFLALVTARLAEAGVPLGAVCGYSRDHLVLAEPHLERARRVLRGLFTEAGSAA
jgi:hypothetical protein